MLLFSLAILLAALPVAVLGGQIPVYNGVPGGAPTNVITEKVFSEIAVDSVSTNVGGLRYVENSGVCGRSPPQKFPSLYANRAIETTPGVFTASGYADLTSTQHMWFWFFAARHNPDKAPLAIWLNGGVSRFAYLNLLVVKLLISQSPEAPL